MTHFVGTIGFILVGVLIGMVVGGAAVHVSWLHAWRMYRAGKQETGTAARRSA